MQIKLAPEFECYSLWVRNSDNEIYDNIDIESLTVSDALKKEFIIWEEAFQRIYDRHTPQNSGFPDIEAATDFVNQGRSLAERIQLELPQADFELSISKPTELVAPIIET